MCSAHKTDGSANSDVSHGPIAEDVTSVRKEPYSLPPGFSWDTLDLCDSRAVSLSGFWELRKGTGI